MSALTTRVAKLEKEIRAPGEACHVTIIYDLDVDPADDGRMQLCPDCGEPSIIMRCDRGEGTDTGSPTSPCIG